jgi:hypothetical protein
VQSIVTCECHNHGSLGWLDLLMFVFTFRLGWVDLLMFVVSFSLGWVDLLMFVVTFSLGWVDLLMFEGDIIYLKTPL